MNNEKTHSLRRLLKYIALGILTAGLFFSIDLFWGTEKFFVTCILGFAMGMISCGVAALVHFILGWIKTASAKKRIKILFLTPYLTLTICFMFFSSFFLGDLQKEFMETVLFLAGTLAAGSVLSSLVALYILWDSRKLEDGEEALEMNLFNDAFTRITGLSPEKDKDKKEYKKARFIYIASIILLVLIFLCIRS